MPASKSSPIKTTKKPKAKNTSGLMSNKLFTKKRMMVFGSIFAVLGAYLVFQSFAYTPQLDGNDGEFTAISPSRTLDTTIGAGQEVSVQITGKYGVPASNVRAVVVNLTAANPTANGFLTAYPSGEGRPDASSLNFAAGTAAIANQITVKVGTDGKIKIFNVAGNTRTIVDVSGYYASKDGPAGARFKALTPSRMVENIPLDSNGVLDVPVLGRHGVPASNVRAVVVNLTAANPTANGFLTAYPSGEGRPNASSLNFAAGTPAIANQITVKVGTDGKIKIFNATGTTRVFVDVSGYFENEISGFSQTQAGRFVSRSPQRIVRGEVIGENKTLVINVGQNVRAAIINITAANPSKNGFITAYPSGTTQPGVSTLNFGAGTPAIANQVIVKAGTDGKIILYNAQGNTTVFVDISGHFIEYEDTYTASASAGFTGLASKAVSKFERSITVDSISNAKETKVSVIYSPFGVVSLGASSLGAGGYDLVLSRTAGKITTNSCYITLSCKRLAAGTEQARNDYKVLTIPYNFTTGTYKVIDQVLVDASGYPGKWVRHSIVSPTGTTTHLYIEKWGTELQGSFNNETLLHMSGYSCETSTETKIRVGNFLLDGKPITLNNASIRTQGNTCPGILRTDFVKGSSSATNMFTLRAGIARASRDTTPPTITALTWNATTKQLRLVASDSGQIVFNVTDNGKSTLKTSIGGYWSDKTLDRTYTLSASNFINSTGPQQIKFDVTDSSGNVSSRTIQFTF